MGLRHTVTRAAVNAATRRATPAAAAEAVRRFLGRAIDGFGTFQGAREVARKQLERTRDVDLAVKEVIEQHVRLAGAQGFVTNVGGIITMPVALPANLAGLAALQVRAAAAIAHLRGYDITEPRVRAASLMIVLGHDDVKKAIKSRRLAGTPHEVATGIVPMSADALNELTALVGSSLVGRVGGKHATLALTRRIPVLGGAVSAGVDAFSTYVAGRYADREFPPLTIVEAG